jgi:hypothetical protein
VNVNSKRLQCLHSHDWSGSGYHPRPTKEAEMSSRQSNDQPDFERPIDLADLPDRGEKP